MNILEDLYYGNLSPYEHYPCVKNLEKLFCRHQTELMETFTETQKSLFEKYIACQNEISSTYDRETFKHGFTMGARIVIEVMRKNPLFDYETQEL